MDVHLSVTQQRDQLVWIYSSHRSLTELQGTLNHIIEDFKSGKSRLLNLNQHGHWRDSLLSHVHEPGALSTLKAERPIEAVGVIEWVDSPWKLTSALF